jgi:lipoate-protein ligase A
MDLDEWLLEQHRQGEQSSILRFYQWEPVAISLGYHQRQFPEFWQTLKWQGQSVELVRRSTGGRAVLHQGDLTYAVITSGLEGNRREIYQQISAFLIEGWRSLGIPLTYGKVGRGYIHNPNCFGSATAADLVTETGYKLVGSAQLYRGNAVLQHGSIRLATDPVLFQQVFEVETGVCNLSHLPQGDALFETVMTALTEAAQRCFGQSLQVQPLTAEEWQAVEARTL